MFRFPNSIEAIADAVKDAINPDTDEKGDRLFQLWGENNRAIEDAVLSAQGSVVITTITVSPNDATSYTWTPDTGQTIVSASATVIGNVDASGQVWIAASQSGFSEGSSGPGLPASGAFGAFPSTTAGASVTIPAVGTEDIEILVAYAASAGGDVTFDLALSAAVARS